MNLLARMARATGPSPRIMRTIDGL